MKKKLSVMLIDDNVLDLYLSQKFIEIETFATSILSFNSSLEALSFLGDCEIPDWPDLIILDIQMPEMDGFEFIDECEKLQNFSSHNCHIIMVSSTLDFGDITRAKANSLVLGLLEKPLKISQLLELLTENAII